MNDHEKRLVLCGATTPKKVVDDTLSELHCTIHDYFSEVSEMADKWDQDGVSLVVKSAQAKPVQLL